MVYVLYADKRIPQPKDGPKVVVKVVPKDGSDVE